MASLQRLLRIGLTMAVNPARIVEDVAGAARRTAILVVCALVAGLILLPALGCAAAGLWIYVQHALGPVWAAFITAAAFLVVAVIVLLVGVIASKPPNKDRKPAEPSRQMGTAAAAIPSVLAALAAPKVAAEAGRGFFNRHKGTALLTAAVIGLVMGQDLLRPGSRRKPAR